MTPSIRWIFCGSTSTDKEALRDMLDFVEPYIFGLSGYYREHGARIAPTSSIRSTPIKKRSTPIAGTARTGSHRTCLVADGRRSFVMLRRVLFGGEFLKFLTEPARATSLELATYDGMG